VCPSGYLPYGNVREGGVDIDTHERARSCATRSRGVKGGGAAVRSEANAGEAGTLQEGGVEEAEAGAHTLPVTARAWRGLVFAFKVTVPTAPLRWLTTRPLD
jgi:hypothetical protein